MACTEAEYRYKREAGAYVRPLHILWPLIVCRDFKSLPDDRYPTGTERSQLADAQEPDRVNTIVLYINIVSIQNLYPSAVNQRTLAFLFTFLVIF